MGKADFYEEGGWNAVCFECGRKRKASQLKKHWQGYYVCPEHWEPRHSQDFVRSIPDVQTPPWAQPMPADVFRLTGFLIPGDGLFTPDIYIPADSPMLAANSSNGLTTTPTVSSGVTSGVCYQIGDIVTVPGGTLTSGGLPTSFIVTGVTNCVITSWDINNSGSYTTPPTVLSTVSLCDSTFDPLAKSSHIALTGSNLIETADGTADYLSVCGNVYKNSGKLYYEFVFSGASVSTRGPGLNKSTNDIADGVANGYSANTGYIYSGSDGNKAFNAGGGIAYGATYTSGDVISVLWDADAGALSFWKNGVDQGSGTPAFTGVTGDFRICVSGYTNMSGTLNISPASWSYTPPAGYTCWGGTSSIPLTYAAFSHLTTPSSHAIIYNPYPSDSNKNLDWVAWDGTNTVLNALGSLFLSSGKRYCEVSFGDDIDHADDAQRVGLANASFTGLDGTAIGNDTNSYAYEGHISGGTHQSGPATTHYNSIATTYGTSWFRGAIVSVLWDADAGTVRFWLNGVDQGQAFAGVLGSFCIAMSGQADNVNCGVNFGASPWRYTPTAGYTGWIG